MREILVMASAYARTDCRDGGEEERRPLRTEVFGQVSLVGNRMTIVAFASRVFLAGNIGFYAQSKPV